MTDSHRKIGETVASLAILAIVIAAFAYWMLARSSKPNYPAAHAVSIEFGEPLPGLDAAYQEQEVASLKEIRRRNDEADRVMSDMIWQWMNGAGW